MSLFEALVPKILGLIIVGFMFFSEVRDIKRKPKDPDAPWEPYISAGMIVSFAFLVAIIISIYITLA